MTLFGRHDVTFRVSYALHGVIVGVDVDTVRVGVGGGFGGGVAIHACVRGARAKK